MVYNPGSGTVILFGGFDRENGQLSDTWEWDSKQWRQLSPSTKPPARETHAMAYDGNGILIYGGLDALSLFDDTWLFKSGTWTKLSPRKSPSARRNHDMVGAGSSVILFGGSDRRALKLLNDTWEWNGKDWVQHFPTTSPPVRFLHALAYDPSRKRVVLFGGKLTSGTLLNDTWEWDGKSWTQLKPATSPEARHGHRMIYDPTIQRVVLYAGLGSTPLTDTWEWNGQTWMKRPTKGNAGQRWSHTLAYDAQRGKVVLFGGRDPSGLLNDTWTYTAAVAGSFTTFGKGCASTSRLPTISSLTMPTLGQPFPVSIRGFLPKAQFGQLILGRSGTRWGLIQLPLSLSIIGAGNCNLLVSPDSSHLIATNAQGSFKTTLKVPALPAFLGATVYGQAWAPDPKSNPVGIATTNAFKVRIGR